MLLNPQIKNLKKSYIDYSLKNIENTQNYYKKINVFNKVTNSITPLKYDFDAIQRDDYNNILQRTTYLQNEIVASAVNYIGFFITLTLPTEYHPFLKVGKKHIKNKNYNKDLTINDGYKKLIEIMRRIQKDMRVDGKKVSLKFIKVVEYHKSLVPHLHAVLFVNEENINEFKKHLSNVFVADASKIEIINNHKNGKKVNKTIYKKNEKIGRVEVEQLENIERTVSYLLKYIKKSLNSNHSIDKHLLNGWKKKNKIRIFTMSNVSIPRYVYKKLYMFLGTTIKKVEGKQFNYLKEFEKICDINVKTYFNEELISNKDFGNENGRYSIIIEKEKIVSYTEEFEDEEFEDEEIEKSIYYKLNEFIIYDNLKDKEIYNKNNFEVLENEISELDLVDEYEYNIDINKIVKKENTKKYAVKFIKKIKYDAFGERIEKKKEEIKEEKLTKKERIQLSFNFGMDYLNDPLTHNC